MHIAQTANKNHGSSPYNPRSINESPSQKPNIRFINLDQPSITAVNNQYNELTRQQRDIRPSGMDYINSNKKAIERRELIDSSRNPYANTRGPAKPMGTNIIANDRRDMINALDTLPKDSSFKNKGLGALIQPREVGNLSKESIVSIEKRAISSQKLSINVPRTNQGDVDNLLQQDVINDDSERKQPETQSVQLQGKVSSEIPVQKEQKIVEIKEAPPQQKEKSFFDSFLGFFVCGSNKQKKKTILI